MRLGSNLLDQRNTLFTLTPKRLATWAKLNFSLLRIDRTFFLKSSEYVIQKIITKTKYFSYILDKMPKSVQVDAKSMIHGMYMSPTKEEGIKAKHPKACKCLTKDEDQLLTFYDYPAQHWQHIRTTNPIESTFATIRHRSRQTKGCGSRIATLSMVFDLAPILWTVLI